MKAYRLPLLALTLAAAPAFATDLDLSLTDDSVKAQVNVFDANANTQVGAGYTYHEGSRHIANVDVHAQGRTALGNLPTTAGIGLQGIYWDDDPFDGGAVGLGGFATVNIPNVPGLSFTGAAHYAPDILSFGDSQDMTSLELRGSYRVIRTAEVFVGYRYLNTDLEDIPGDADLDEGVMAGMKLYF